MSSQVWKILVVGMVLSVVGIRCKDDSNPGDMGSPSNIVFPPNNVSYDLHVQPLFDQTCALSGCHDRGTNQSPLKLTSHGETVFLIPGVVVPGNPENSTLVLRIEGRVSQRMPLNRNPLNDNQINGIRTWIVEGAQNN
ncbi:MAG TPA: hypothetical protein VFG32_01830 [Bacteroidota bacterium]|nr:hypothetical protein [Bacteroidota bacterium]